MKLSRIIELALINYYGFTKKRSPFMCCAISKMQTKGMLTEDQELDAIREIHELKRRIAGPDGTIWASLCSTLQHAGYIPIGSYENAMPYTSELYVWWVYDLKNKGL